MDSLDKEQLYTEYHDKVYAYLVSKLCNREDAEDLCSEVFLKVYSHLDEFDGAQASVSTWIYSITRNTLYDHFRTNHASAELDDDSPEELPTPEDKLCSDETLEELAAALMTLRKNERDLILLYYYGGHSLKETADKIGISYSYAKALHSTALKNLRKKIDF